MHLANMTMNKTIARVATIEGQSNQIQIETGARDALSTTLVNIALDGALKEPRKKTAKNTTITKKAISDSSRTDEGGYYLYMSDHENIEELGTEYDEREDEEKEPGERLKPGKWAIVDRKEIFHWADSENSRRGREHNIFKDVRRRQLQLDLNLDSSRR
ncbi:hypothetical protein JTB14_033706 [Gonioctena quinquepunctata]|nr:hypothetical protein JTB14_033706 [Gonioctena quinquepunctata]